MFLVFCIVVSFIFVGLSPVCFFVLFLKDSVSPNIVLGLYYIILLLLFKISINFYADFKFNELAKFKF